MKKRARLGGWQKRFFAIGPGELLYWKDDCLFSAGVEPDGAFNLAQLDQAGSDRNTIVLRFGAGQATGSRPDVPRHCVTLWADSAELATCWLWAIREEVGKLLKDGDFAVPARWDIAPLLDGIPGGPRLVAKTPGSNAATAQFQALVDRCWIQKATRDRRGQPLPKGLEIVSVEEIQNVTNFQNYRRRQREINVPDHHWHSGRLPTDDIKREVLTAEASSLTLPSLPGLDSTKNERWLFHGSTHRGLQGITDGDFRIDLSGSRGGTMYGNGIYMAECSSKADEYSDVLGNHDDLRGMLLCRVTLGRILHNDELRPDARKLESEVRHGRYHSLLGDRLKAAGTFREFILFDPHQVYPNFIIWYRHRF